MKTRRGKTKASRAKRAAATRRVRSQVETVTKLKRDDPVPSTAGGLLPAEIPVSWAGKVPHVSPGKYADGLPYHKLTYLAFKLVLKPNIFVTRDSLFDLSKTIGRLADEFGVDFSRVKRRQAPIRIREVIFRDTPDHRFYNNAFILRRRIVYEDGFPTGEPEIVFKYRSDNLQKAAETDVRPQISGSHRIKFKAQLLPLKGKLGGVRMLYSHNVQFPRSNGPTGDVFTMEALTGVFPVLSRIKMDPDRRVALVNDTIIEEVLQDIGVLDFGFGLTAKTDVGIWRTRGEHRPLIGELAYQIKFKERNELPLEAMKQAERFFVALQYATKDILALNATKTGVVYRLLGNAPTSHE